VLNRMETSECGPGIDASRRYLRVPRGKQIKRSLFAGRRAFEDYALKAELPKALMIPALLPI
jgi:hypothetical protein